MLAHLDVDTNSLLANGVVVTPTSVNSVTLISALLHRQEQGALGDAGH